MIENTLLELLFHLMQVRRVPREAVELVSTALQLWVRANPDLQRPAVLLFAGGDEDGKMLLARAIAEHFNCPEAPIHLTTAEPGSQDIPPTDKLLLQLQLRTDSKGITVAICDRLEHASPETIEALIHLFEVPGNGGRGRIVIILSDYGVVRLRNELRFGFGSTAHSFQQWYEDEGERLFGQALMQYAQVVVFPDRE